MPGLAILSQPDTQRYVPAPPLSPGGPPGPGDPTTPGWVLVSDGGAGGHQAGVNNRIGFGGYWFQPELGLYLVRHRAYDPKAGRWLQRDPIG